MSGKFMMNGIEYLGGGSGGGGGNVDDVYVNGESVLDGNKIAQVTSYKEVTLAEYMALPDTKLNDGVMYCIKDVGGANQFPPLIYSDEEREVGVWRDGKPLYQRTISFSISGGTNATSLGVTNMGMCLMICAFKVDGTNSTFIPFVDIEAGSSIDSWSAIVYRANLSSGDITYRAASRFAGQTVYATFQYTKTTDTAGSGTWTTQGGYAHHYSTTEQIIGTYNGKPLYQKSFFGIDFVNGRKDYQHGIANVDKIFIDNSATFIYKKNKTESGPFLFAGYNDQAQFVEGYGRIIQIVTPTVIIMKANANIYSDYTADITVRYTKTTD